MRRLVLVALAACGRVGFNSSVDAGGSLAIRQTMSLLSASNPVGLSIGATGAGNLLVLATSNITSTEVVSSLTDDAGNTYVSAGSNYTDKSVTVGEVWYAASSNPNATELTIANPNGVLRELWFVEVVGARLASPLDAVATISDAPQVAPVSSPPVTPTSYPAIVIAQMNVSGSIGGLACGSEFVALPLLHGDDTAYQIVGVPGTYQATWNAPTESLYGAASVAFAAQP
jgi:hypothetical protein